MVAAVIPVDQTKFGPIEGNCFTACVASLLELSLDDVPWFMTPDDGRWLERLQAWCGTRGLAAKYWPARGWCDEDPEARPFLGVPTGLAIMSGESPRNAGVFHAVIARAGALVHDPNPSRAGVLGELEHHDFVTIEPCTHEHSRRGADIPRVYGSWRSEVCDTCGAFRERDHHDALAPSWRWRPAAEYSEATAAREDD